MNRYWIYPFKKGQISGNLQIKSESLDRTGTKFNTCGFPIPNVKKRQENNVTNYVVMIQNLQIHKGFKCNFGLGVTPS